MRYFTRKSYVEEFITRRCSISATGKLQGVYITRTRSGRDTSRSKHAKTTTSQYLCSVYFYFEFAMSSVQWFLCALVLVCVSVQVSPAPAPAPAPQEENYPPMPYEYKYDVEDQEKLLYFGANEAGDAQGKVIGGYRVLLPDGRLMTVEYTVEGDSGFVPKIKFEDNANPFGKRK